MKLSIGRDFQTVAMQRKKTVDIDILGKFRNGDRKIMLSIKIMSKPPS